MDSLTHGLLGATIAQAGFRHRLGRTGTLLGAGLALLPDFDFVVKFILDDPFATLRHHRAETHSLPVLTLAAPLLAWGIWRLRRRRERFRDWWLMTWLVLLSAALLDACTTYGTQLLAPFTRHRFSWDCISIVDLFYTLPLLLAFLVAIMPRIPPRISQRIAIVVLLLTTAYIGLGVHNRRQALDIVRSLPVYANQEEDSPDKAEADFLATPCFSTIWLWRVVTRTRTESAETQRVYLVSTWTGRIVGQEMPGDSAPRFSIQTGVQPPEWSRPAGLHAADPPTPGSAPPSPLPHPETASAPDSQARTDRDFFFATRTIPHPPPPLVRRALDSGTGRLLLWFSNGWLTWETAATPEGTEVFLYDLRYGTAGAPTQTPFAWVLLQDAEGATVSVTRLRPWGGGDKRLGWSFIREEWRRTWDLTWRR